MRRKYSYTILTAVLLLITAAGLLFAFLPASDARLLRSAARIEARCCYAVTLGKGDTLRFPIVPTEPVAAVMNGHDPHSRADITGIFVSGEGHILTTDSLLFHAPSALTPAETRSRIAAEDSLAERMLGDARHELKELDYYARTHSVVDDGYNEVMACRERTARRVSTLDSLRSLYAKALQSKQHLSAHLDVKAKVLFAWTDDSSRAHIDTLACTLVARDNASRLLLLQTASHHLPAHACRVSMNWCGVGKAAVRTLAFADYGGRTARTFASIVPSADALPASAMEGGACLSQRGHMKGLRCGAGEINLSAVRTFLRSVHAWPVWQCVNLRSWMASWFGPDDASSAVVKPVEAVCRHWATAEGTYSGQAVALRDGRLVRQGYGEWHGRTGAVWRGQWQADTLTAGERIDSLGVYQGDFRATLEAEGTGCYLSRRGEWYEGNWHKGRRDGHGYSIQPTGMVRCGAWRSGRFWGERMVYTADRVYGIDISRYQHEDARYPRRTFAIDWDHLRITSLGSGRRVSGTVDYPVSFVYIKATQGTRIVSKYYAADLRQARRHGIPVGSYHFYSPKYNGTQQAAWFLRQANVADNDLPPVLDLEPTEAEVREMGGEAAMFREVLKWMHIVEARRGKRPVLYVGQQFVNQHLVNAPAELRDYDVWIARYGEFKPYVHLLHWQLTPYGRVRGIRGEVDINVFNGTRSQFEDYLRGE